MLVIPALLSLKPQLVEKECEEIKELVIAILKRIKNDKSDIVQKTGKKLILELIKNFPQSFKSFYLDKLSIEEDKMICKAVINNDDILL